jgi:hypothetical protein
MGNKFSDDLLFWFITRVAPNPRFRSPGELNFGRRHVIVVGPHDGTCFMSLLWRREFWHVKPPGSGVIGLVTE